MSTDPGAAASRVTAGGDWAKDDHVVDLAGHRVAAASQLRARLQIAFPAATALLAAIDSEITLAFLSRFTTQDQAGWLSPKRLAAWLKSVACSGRTGPAVLHARLLAAP